MRDGARLDRGAPRKPAVLLHGLAGHATRKSLSRFLVTSTGGGDGSRLRQTLFRVLAPNKAASRVEDSAPIHCGLGANWIPSIAKTVSM